MKKEALYIGGAEHGKTIEYEVGNEDLISRVKFHFGGENGVPRDEYAFRPVFEDSSQGLVWAWVLTGLSDESVEEKARELYALPKAS